MCDHMTVFVVRVTTRKDTNDSYYAFCPGLPGIHVPGSTKKEAINEALESVIDMITMYKDRGEQIPENDLFYILKEPKSVKELAKDDVIIPIPAHLASHLLDCDRGI